MLGKDTIERTTVTNRVRRIFTWSNKQYMKTQYILGNNSVFMNFCNYLDEDGLKEFMTNLNRANLTLFKDHGIKSTLEWVGKGPGHNDIL